MNDYVIAGKKLYALKDKITRSKAGREYINKHVKLLWRLIFIPVDRYSTIIPAKLILKFRLKSTIPRA